MVSLGHLRPNAPEIVGMFSKIIEPNVFPLDLKQVKMAQIAQMPLNYSTIP